MLRNLFGRPKLPDFIPTEVQSIGESLATEDHFILEIPLHLEAASVVATKRGVFRDETEIMSASMSVASTVSSVTLNSSESLSVFGGVAQKQPTQTQTKTQTKTQPRSNNTVFNKTTTPSRDDSRVVHNSVGPNSVVTNSMNSIVDGICKANPCDGRKEEMIEQDKKACVDLMLCGCCFSNTIGIPCACDGDGIVEKDDDRTHATQGETVTLLTGRSSLKTDYALADIMSDADEQSDNNNKEEMQSEHNRRRLRSRGILPRGRRQKMKMSRILKRRKSKPQPTRVSKEPIFT